MSAATLPLLDTPGVRSGAPVGRGSALSPAPVPAGPLDDVEVPTTTDDPALADRVLATLADVDDPELPIGLVDLGLIRRLTIANGHVTVGLTYTSLACPCVEMIREDVTDAVAALDGVSAVTVDDVLEPWSRDDVTPHGRALLRAVAVV